MGRAEKERQPDRASGLANGQAVPNGQVGCETTVTVQLPGPEWTAIASAQNQRNAGSEQRDGAYGAQQSDGVGGCPG